MPQNPSSYDEVRVPLSKMTFTPDVPATALAADEYNAGFNVETDVRGIRSVSGQEAILKPVPGAFAPIFITGGFRRGGEWWFVAATEGDGINVGGKWYACSSTVDWYEITPAGIDTVGYTQTTNITETWNGTVLLINDEHNPPFFWLDEAPSLTPALKMQAYSNQVPLSIANIQPATTTTKKITFTAAQPHVPFAVGDYVIINNVYPSDYNSLNGANYTPWKIVDCTNSSVTIENPTTATYSNGGTVAPQYSWNYNTDWDKVHAGWMRMYQTPNVGTILVAGNLTASVFTDTVVSSQGTVGTIDGNGLDNTLTTYTVSGASVSAAGTYLNIPQKSTTGSGSGAIFNIQKTGNGLVYSGHININTSNSGKGYNIGDSIVIAGDKLGGTTPANDLTLKINAKIAGQTGTSVAAAGTYTAVTPASTSGSGTGMVLTITKTGNGTDYAATGLLNGSTTYFNRAGVSQTAAATYTGVSQSSTTGAGSGATFNITKTGNGTSYAATGLITASTTYTTFTGTSVTAAATYIGVKQKTTTGLGQGAIFNITKTGGGTTYAGAVSMAMTTNGSGYAVGDQITISGADLGGTTPANDFTFTLATSVGAATSITLVADGSGYALGDQVTIAGTALGGATPANDLTFYIGASVSKAITATITNSGSNYNNGDTVTIAGTALGGATPANDMVITLGQSLGSPWLAHITGMASTAGLNPGDQITAIKGSGSLGTNGIYTVDHVVSASEIVFKSQYGTTPIAGTITDITKLHTGTEIENFPVTVLWSQSFGLNQAPVTWTPTATNVANQLEVPLRGASIDAFPCNGQFFLCSYWDTVVFSPLNYSTTSAPIIGVKLLNQGRGLLSSNCWANTDRLVYGIDARDIWVFDGNDFKGIGNQRVRNWFFDQLDPQYYNRIHMQTNTQKSQIEIYYPDKDSFGGKPNKMLSYRYDLDVWNAPIFVAEASFACESPVFTGSSATVSNVAGTNVPPYTGAGATFDISYTGATYSAVVNNPGSGYQLNGQIIISGVSMGGTTPANDVLLTITSGPGPSGTGVATVVAEGRSPASFTPNLASRTITYIRGTHNGEPNPRYFGNYEATLVQKDLGYSLINNAYIFSNFERDNLKLCKDYSSKVMVHRVLPEIVNLDGRGIPVTPGTGAVNIAMKGANSVGSTPVYLNNPTSTIAEDHFVTVPTDATGYTNGTSPWAQFSENAYRVNSVELNYGSDTTTWMCNALTFQVTVVEDDR